MSLCSFIHSFIHWGWVLHILPVLYYSMQCFNKHPHTCPFMSLEKIVSGLYTQGEITELLNLYIWLNNSRSSPGWVLQLILKQECMMSLFSPYHKIQGGFMAVQLLQLRRSAYLVQCSLITILKSLITLSLNLCFVSEVRRDHVACMGAEETHPASAEAFSGNLAAAWACTQACGVAYT